MSGNFESSGQRSLGRSRIERAEACSICGKGGHSTGECQEIVNLTKKSEKEKEEIFSRVNRLIEQNGVGKLGEENMQILLNQAGKEKQGELIAGIVKHYNLGDGLSEKTKSQMEIYPGGEKKIVSEKVKMLEKANSIILDIPGRKEVKIVVDKVPVKYDKDFGQYVFRYSFVGGDGKAEDVVRVSPLSVLIFAKEDVEEGLNNEVIKKAA